MKQESLLFLNVFAVIGMIFYAIGIYLETAILKKIWGNSAINLSIQVFGPLYGVIVVTLVEIGFLFLSYLISKIKGITIATNVFLCWFWILSLYQCAINSMLNFYNLPNEPINLFFKSISPDLWYPLKELAFIAISIIMMWIWSKKVDFFEFTKIDMLIIVALSVFLWLAVATSQITLINAESNVYS